MPTAQPTISNVPSRSTTKNARGPSLCLPLARFFFASLVGSGQSQNVRGVNLPDLSDTDVASLGMSKLGDRKFFFSVVTHALLIDEAYHSGRGGGVDRGGAGRRSSSTSFEALARARDANATRSRDAPRPHKDVEREMVEVVVKKKSGAGRERERRMTGPPLIVSGPTAVALVRLPDVSPGEPPRLLVESDFHEGNAKRQRLPNLTIDYDKDAPLQLIDTPPSVAESTAKRQRRLAAVDPRSMISPKATKTGGFGGGDFGFVFVDDPTDATKQRDHEPQKKNGVKWDERIVGNKEIPIGAVTA